MKVKNVILLIGDYDDFGPNKYQVQFEHNGATWFKDVIANTKGLESFINSVIEDTLIHATKKG